jgi:hypothetical protein
MGPDVRRDVLKRHAKPEKFAVSARRISVNISSKFQPHAGFDKIESNTLRPG